MVGSNTHSILGIGGVTGLIAPVSVPGQIVVFDNPAMVLASLLLGGYALYLFLIWPWQGAGGPA